MTKVYKLFSILSIINTINVTYIDIWSCNKCCKSCRWNTDSDNRNIPNSQNGLQNTNKILFNASPQITPLNNIQNPFTGDKYNNDINENSMQPNTLYNSIREEFPFHERIALRNVGATCYMNATLQCLCNIEKLVNYFKYHQTIEKYIKNHGKSTLTYSFKYLVENLWQSKGSKYIIPQCNGKNTSNKYFSPTDFKEKISKMNPLFEGVQANDAKDLVNFIIMTLHEELNKIKNPNQSWNNTNINQTNHDMVLQNFIQNFRENNKSIISDLFYAMNGTSTKCSKCNEIKYNLQNYFFLIFPLEEVRKFKIQKIMNNSQNMMFMNPLLFQQNLNQLYNSQSVNMDDCFQYNEKIDFFTGENAMYCNRCKGQFNSYYSTKLYYGPEILIIILNRGKGIEFNVKLEFTEKIDLSNYFQLKNLGNVYNLIGVVTHIGESGASGHFIANAKSPIDGQWYTYNDDLVYKVDNFKKQIIDYAMPYILFYQKVG